MGNVMLEQVTIKPTKSCKKMEEERKRGWLRKVIQMG
jgi:hypothetical protein